MGLRGIVGALCAVAMMLTGACATIPSDAPPFSRAAAAPAGLENLYIYRQGAYPTMRSPIVRINGKEIVSPPEGSYTVVPITPGTHTVLVEWSWDTGWPNLDFPIEVKPGESFYMKISGSFEQSGLNYRAGSSASQVEPVAAETEMKTCCRYIRPRGTP